MSNSGTECFKSSQQPGPSTESDVNHRQYLVTYSQSYQQTMRKIQQLGLFSWCGENLWKDTVSAEFSHQDIRSNYDILRSEIKFP